MRHLQGVSDPQILIVFDTGTRSGHRDFTARAPKRPWVADATRIPTGEGVSWTAAVRDALSNRIVGWKRSDRCDTEPMLGALEYAVWARDMRDGQLAHRFDRGSTWTAIRFANRLADNGIAQHIQKKPDRRSPDDFEASCHGFRPEPDSPLSYPCTDEIGRREIVIAVGMSPGRAPATPSDRGSAHSGRHRDHPRFRSGPHRGRRRAAAVRRACRSASPSRFRISYVRRRSFHPVWPARR